jgi:hypothetical protein
LFVAVEINRYLRENVSPQLLADELGQFRSYVRPFNLVGAIWYQMFQAYCGEQKVARCSVCHSWMTFERTTKSMHRRCANRRRQQIVREKKAKQNVKKTRSR